MSTKTYFNYLFSHTVFGCVGVLVAKEKIPWSAHKPKPIGQASVKWSDLQQEWKGPTELLGVIVPVVFME